MRGTRPTLPLLTSIAAVAVLCGCSDSNIAVDNAPPNVSIVAPVDGASVA